METTEHKLSFDIEKLELNAGERYIGAIGDALGNVHHLILLPGDIVGSWKDAMDWAKSIGGLLPSRIEQALLFATANDAFNEEIYWSRQEWLGHGGPDQHIAWAQSFLYGVQCVEMKNRKQCARAIRTAFFCPCH